jgi:small GTP-binding protein
VLRETYKKKIVLLGDSGVGKTSLIRRFVEGSFDEKYILTIGTNVMRKSIEYDDIHQSKIRMELIIWDVLGQEGFERVKNQAYRGAEGAFLVGDLTRPDSIRNTLVWADAVRSIAGHIPLIILGNKVDLIDEPTESLDTLKDTARSLSVKYYLTSAKTGLDVEEAFRSLGREIHLRSSARRVGSVPRLNPKIVADVIIDTFCLVHGGYEEAMPLVQSAFNERNADIRKLTIDNLREVVSSLESKVKLHEHERESYNSFLTELNRQMKEGIALPDTEPVPASIKEVLSSHLKTAIETGNLDLSEEWVLKE